MLDYALGETPSLGSGPLSYEEEGFFVLYSLDPMSSAFNTGGAIQIMGKLDVAMLERACNEIIARHDSLRTAVTVGPDGSVRQAVHRYAWTPLPTLDLSTEVRRSPERRQEIVMSAIDREQSAPFDLSSGKPLRLQLLTLSPTDHAFVVVTHHILSDAESEQIFLSEVGEAYSALVERRSPRFEPLPLQYWMYATAQRAGNAKRRTHDLKYWVEQLRGVRPLALPGPSASGGGAPTDPVASEPPNASVATLFKVAAEEGTTPFAAYVSAVQIALGALAGADEVPVGYPVSLRQHNTKRSIGLFMNTLVFRGRFSRDQSFRSIVRATGADILRGLQHRLAPFHHVVRELNPTRKGRYTTLYNVAVSLWDGAKAGVDDPLPLSGLRTVRLGPPLRPPQADLELLGFLVDSKLVIQIVSDGERVDRRAIEALGSFLPALFDALARSPDAPVSRVWRIDDREPASRWLDLYARMPLTAGVAPADGDACGSPQTETEKMIAAVWSEFLGVDGIHREDNFFELGGYSLLATRIALRLQKVFGREVSMALFFDAPTLAGLASRIDALQVRA